MLKRILCCDIEGKTIENLFAFKKFKVFGLKINTGSTEFNFKTNE